MCFAERICRRERPCKGMCLSGALVRPLFQERKNTSNSQPGRLRGKPQQASRSRANGPGRARSDHTSALQSLTLASSLLAPKDQIRICGCFCQRPPVKQGGSDRQKPVKSLRGWMWSLESHVNASERGTWVRLELSLPYPARLSRSPCGSPACTITCWVFQKAAAACIVSNQLKPPTAIYFSAFLLRLKCLCMTVLLLMQTGETRVNCYLWSFWRHKSHWQKICQVFHAMGKHWVNPALSQRWSVLQPLSIRFCSLLDWLEREFLGQEHPHMLPQRYHKSHNN